jgi:septum formation protein
MLESLSGRENIVITGVCLCYQDQIISFSDRTVITFDALTPDNIDQYLDMKVCYDRAGAYGIQDWIGLIGVLEIRGSYTNVMGLPTHLLFKELNKF